MIIGSWTAIVTAENPSNVNKCSKQGNLCVRHRNLFKNYETETRKIKCFGRKVHLDKVKLEILDRLRQKFDKRKPLKGC